VARASIDIGSNSLVFLVVDDHGKTIHDEAAIVGLGKGLGDLGAFQDHRMAAAMVAFESFAATATTHGIRPEHVRAIATSAARRARNATAYFQSVKEQTGICVEVISGMEEARLTWLGGLHGLDLPNTAVAVVDLGGGSTEIVMGLKSQGRVTEQQSLEMGTVRLMEAFGVAESDRYEPPALDAMKTHIDQLIHSIDWSHSPSVLVAVAGTATTIAAMELGLRKWDREAVHGFTMKREDLAQWTRRLTKSTHQQRVEWAAVSPERADLLVAGAAVLEAVCGAAQVDSLTISDGGIRHGALLS
jgi:exopolyphosphatase/guanosine-5'-triphosphate,3'-diphosphate pyrophosphatase